MIFSRKIYQKLLDWKNKYSSNYALLIEGAKGVGKSTIVEEFAKHEYKSYILIDFSKQQEDVISLFNEMTDLDFIFLRLQSIYHVNLIEKESLIIFDEVQYCPKARQTVKALVKDGRFSYIETGSFISIKQNVQDILIPSEEMTINMYPMDFEEFLSSLKKLCSSQIKDNNPNSLTKLFKLYMRVGGLPEVVACYIETNNLDAVEEVKRKILDLYHNDFKKIDNSGRLSKLFNFIPSSLEHNKNHYSISFALQKRVTLSTRKRLISELICSNTVIPCYHVANPGEGLSLTKERDKFKLYIADTGLLYTIMSHNENNEKTLYENAVATQLLSNGYNLYYHTFPNVKSHRNYKIDFLINMNEKICPIVIKTSKRKSTPSLDAFCNKYKESITTNIILQTNNISLV